MKLTQKQGENLWQHLVEVLGVSTTYQKENMVALDERSVANLTVPLEKDVFLKINGFNMEIRLVRTRYNKTNTLLSAGKWEFKSERWNISENDRLAADVFDTAAPMLASLSKHYPHLSPMASRAIEWVSDLDAAAQARIQYHREKDKRQTRKINFWFYILAIGFILLFLYVVAEGDPSRCIYIPDPRGGYVDC